VIEDGAARDTRRILEQPFTLTQNRMPLSRLRSSALAAEAVKVEFGRRTAERLE